MHRAPAARGQPTSPSTTLAAALADQAAAADPGSRRCLVQVARGETLSLVGESGCGKTTTAKSVMRLIEPTSGSVELEGKELLGMPADAMRQHRRDLQIIFQDPYASLNPRLTAGEIVAEPLRNFGVVPRGERRERGAVAVLARRPAARRRRTSTPTSSPAASASASASRGRWRCNPKLIVCDEPVSALDVSVQAQVVNLLMDLQAEFGIAYLFVAHDLAVVRHISHRVAVMYLGHIVEIADRDTLFASPRHPYTEVLLSAVPVPDPRARAKRMLLQGDPPSPAQPAVGLPLPHPLPAGPADLQASSALSCARVDRAQVAGGTGRRPLRAAHRRRRRSTRHLGRIRHPR